MKKYMTAAAALMIGAALLAGGCGSEKQAAKQAPLVKTMVVGTAQEKEPLAFSGTVHGHFESALALQTGGRIMQRYVQAGDRVTAGTPLFKVDSKDAEEQKSAAESAVISARAQYDLAESTLRRYKSLHDIHAISDLALDQVQNSYDLASAQLSSAEATLARAENNLSFTTLLADRDGIIGATYYEVGQVISAGTPVALIVDDAEMEVRISFTEKQYGEYAVGTPCKVTFWAFPGVSAEGVVYEKAAAPNTSTGTYDAKVRLASPPAGLAVGMTAEVKFERKSSGALSVPLAAIAGQSEAPAVWVVKDGKAALISVKTGEYGKDAVEITEGLSEGDRVITAGGQKLHEGEEVRI